MFARRTEMVARRLDLDPGQRAVFERIHEQTGRLLLAKRSLIGEKRAHLRDLVAQEDVDEGLIRATITELGQEQAVLDSLVAETMLQEMAVLEPHQRERYLEMFPFEREGRGQRHGRPGRGGHRQ
jgi:Spy/CpxP family protein refolding chaperone